MSRRRRAAVDLPLLVATAVLLLDQVSKWFVAGWLGQGREAHRYELIGPLLAVEYATNTGAAFGTFRGQGFALGLAAALVLGGLVLYYRRQTAPSRWTAISVGLLTGGALGNLVDRARLGYVVDFVAVGIWPKFNVADSAITVGVALLAWQVLRSPRPSSVSPRPADAPAGHGESGQTGDRRSSSAGSGPADQTVIADGCSLKADG